MNLNAIPIFLQVIQCGGFTKAATKLGITTSQVSKNVSTLENGLGIKLLHRTTRKISLTEAGERYYQQATKGIHFIEDAERSAMELQKVPKGHLRVTAPMSFGHLHVSPLIPQFLKQYPGISIELVLDDKEHDLLEQNLDVAIRTGNLIKDSSVIARKLCDLKSALCASNKYLEEYGTPKTPNDLLEHNCLLFSLSKPKNEWAFKQGKKQHIIHVSGNFQVNNGEALRESLLAGIGIGRLPTFIAGRDIERGSLIQVLSKYQMNQIPLYVIFPERNFLPLKVRVFVDFLVKYLSNNDPHWDNFTLSGV